MAHFDQWKRVNEYNALIAQYYEKAGDLLHAAAYLHRAGEHWLNISAYSEARATFEHTLLLLPAGDLESTGLTVQMGIACYYLADYPLARHHLNAAFESPRRHNYHREAAHALYWLSQISNETDGSYEDARRHLEEALQLARAHQPESALEARILYGLGDVNWRLGNFDQERTYCEQSVALAQRLGDINTELYALNRLGTLAYLENLDAAGSFFQQVYDKAMMHGDCERSAHALNNIGNVFMKKGDLAGAKSFIEKALALIQEIGCSNIPQRVGCSTVLSIFPSNLAILPVLEVMLLRTWYLRAKLVYYLSCFTLFCSLHALFSRKVNRMNTDWRYWAWLSIIRQATLIPSKR